MSEPLNSIGKLMVIAGIILLLAGVMLIYFQKIPFIGKLPGDIFYKKGNFTFYFPVVTSILLSIVVSLIIFVLNKSRL